MNSSQRYPKPDDRSRFLDRIFAEAPLWSDDKFVFVSDADPVVDGHVLLVPRGPHRSLADEDPVAIEKVLSSFLSEVARDYLIFEHGHGPLCSSMGAFVHAHAHLVPAVNLGPVRLPVNLPNEYSSVVEALASVPVHAEYLLWGHVGGSMSLVVAPSLPKRAIRKALEESRAQ